MTALDDPSWTATKAAHLARRAGFGATPAELERLVAMGQAAAVASYVDFPVEDVALDQEIHDAGGSLAAIQFGAEPSGTESVREVADRVRRWWFYRLVRTHHPLQEKLTLVWHDHFACQQSKIIRQDQYLGQNRLFRRNAAGSFRTLLREVSRDAGMLTYLDNRLNEAANPNENWGRELLELFTLGVDNGYTQKDVWELSRVFTGWSTPDVNASTFLFRPEAHDPTDKVLFGEPIAGRAGAEGIQEGGEALDRILQRPECADFIASKLLAWFVSDDPPPEQVARFGAVLRDSDYSIREMLRAVFSSEWFYAPGNRLTSYRNPVDFVVSAARLLEVQNAHLLPLDEATRSMGMQLFEPPSVAGWPQGAVWVNSSTTVHRFNYALLLSDLPHTSRQVSGKAVLDLDRLAGDDEVEDAVLVDRLADRLLQRGLPDRDVIVACLAESDGWLPADTSPRSRRRAKTRTAIHLMLTTPGFALA